MGILDFIKRLFTGGSKSKLINIYIKDDKCGEKIKLVLRKGYDIVREFDEDKEASFSTKKVAICDNCYSNIEVFIEFDNNYNIISKNIENGEFITKDEYYSDS